MSSVGKFLCHSYNNCGFILGNESVYSVDMWEETVYQ